MDSLIRELQRDAQDPNTSVAELVKKALLVANKLDHDQEFRKWVSSELNGYKRADTPEYRCVDGKPKQKIAGGWQDVRSITSLDLILEEKLSRIRITFPISKVESIAKGNDEPVVINYEDKFVYVALTHLIPVPKFHCDKASFHQILEAVRNRILDWALELGESQPVTDKNPHMGRSNVSSETGKSENPDSSTQLARIKERFERKAKQHTTRVLLAILGGLIVTVIVLGTLTQLYNLWDTIEPWAYYLGLIVSFGSWTILAIVTKELSPKAIFNYFVERKKDKYYREFGLDEEIPLSEDLQNNSTASGANTQLEQLETQLAPSETYETNLVKEQSTISRHIQDLKDLVHRLNYGEWSERRNAALTLRSMAQQGKNLKPVLPELIKALDNTDATVFQLITDALGYMREDAVEAVPRLIQELNPRTPDRASKAADALRKIGTPEAQQAVEEWARKEYADSE